MNCKSSCTEMCIRTAYKFLVTNKRLEQSSLFRIANIYRSINKRPVIRQIFYSPIQIHSGIVGTFV